MALWKTAAVVALVGLTAALSITYRSSATTPGAETTGTCVDGSGTRWWVRITWGVIYSDGYTDRVVVDTVRWTTASRWLDTSFTIRNDDGLVPAWAKSGSASPDYEGGRTYYSRNPRNPISAPGQTRIVVSLGRVGSPTCSVTQRQPFAATAARRLLGGTASGLPWHSGVWAGQSSDTPGMDAFGAWRGRPADVATSYFDRSSYQAMMDNTWAMTAWQGFPGRLSIGLRMLPDDGAGTLAEISDGRRDAVWTTIAQNLVAAGRGNSIIRLSWESNVASWRGPVTASNAAAWKAAFRHVVATMRAVAPGLLFEFGINCGSGLAGSSDRLAPLVVAYPGDDVVDLVGCDTYDWWSTHADSSTTWPRVLRPSSGPGLQDVVDFARAHAKGASFAEWGLAANHDGNNGGDDNPYYISAMFDFFSANADVVAFECYFNEGRSADRHAIFDPDQNTAAAATYAQLW